MPEVISGHWFLAHSTRASINRIAGCRLDLPRHWDEELDDYVETGHWVKATCEEFCEAFKPFGGWGRNNTLKVWSGWTAVDPDFTGETGCFTCWGTVDRPVAASGRIPWDKERLDGSCPDDHAIFVPEEKPSNV